MKKFSSLLIISILSIAVLRSQNVDSVKIEQAGELIKIHYKILNSNQYQTFRVNVFCSINGGLKSELKSLSGDFGGNVVGGRTDYLVLWDVLKDVDEVKSVDFSVRAELIKDESPKLAVGSKKRFHLLAESQFTGPKFGIQIGFMGSWGVSTFFLYGKTSLDKNHKTSSAPLLSVPCYGFQLTKRILNKEDFKMHLMAGFALTKLIVYNVTGSFYTTNEGFYAGPDFGIMMDIKRIAISLSVVDFNPKFEGLDVKEMFSPATYVNAGIGIRF